MHGSAVAASGGEAAGSGIDVYDDWSYSYDKFTIIILATVQVLDEVGKINWHKRKIDDKFGMKTVSRKGWIDQQANFGFQPS